MNNNSEARRFEVFTIRDYMQDRQQKSQWTKVGVAFENNDGSWNLRLHALPLTDPKTGLAHLHMRPPQPKNDVFQHANGNNIVQAGGDITGNVEFTPRNDIPF